MFNGKKSRPVVLVTAGVMLAGATAGVAYAVADNIKAPYVQAAATVQGNGATYHTKGIDSVRRLASGEYCVTFSDTELRGAKAIAQATVHSPNRVAWTSWSDTGCGNARNLVKVTTTDLDGANADSWFTVSVH